MEVTVLSVGKSVLNGALGYAKSAVAEEVALQLGVRRDQAFITDELEMMQGFLMTAHDERDDNKVVKIWVKQVRDVAYDVEDCLMDFAVRLHNKSWWRIPRTLLDRRHVAKQMKELRAKVEDVSQRNTRYNLIKGSSSKSTAVAKRHAITGATMSNIDEAKRQQDKAISYLIRLITTKKGDELRVIAVWGATTSNLGEMPIIKRAYEDPKMHGKFECHAWFRLMHPFNPIEFLQSIIRQFYANFLQVAGDGQSTTMEGQDIRRMGLVNEDCLIDEFKRYVNEKTYLIVIEDLLTVEEWDSIKTCFPHNRKGSRVIVCTEHVEVASLCVGPKNMPPEHKQLMANQPFYAFYEKDFPDGVDSSQAGSSSNTTASDSTISVDRKSLTRIETMIHAFKETEPIGREKEKSDIIELIANKGSQHLEVISLWGMGGLGKTTLVRDIYQRQELIGKFEKRACVTIMRPFNPVELLRSLVVQVEDSKTREEMDMTASKPKIRSLAEVLEGKKYLIVLDDVSSTGEWDAIMPHLHVAAQTGSRMVITTREKNIALRCSSQKQENIYNLQSLEYKAAHDLFTEKIFGEITNLDEKYPYLVEPAKQLMKRCNGLPLAIVTIGGFLAKQPKTALEWRKLNEHISAELEMNPELETITTVLNKSFDGLPYHLKSCFLYLPIFPEDWGISRRRLVRRWTAEGYPVEVRGKSAEETANNYLTELISRSMILPLRQSNYSNGLIYSCQVHDLIREIAISKSMEENLVFRLEEGNNLKCQGTTRHLVVSSNWHGDKSEFESMVDLTHIRSFTVFGEWRPFYISDKMKLLRVLDLGSTSGLVDHHLVHLGKLLHLRYLSLRDCEYICHLPQSVGNLSQLETLDIKGTQIIKLPRTIIKLRKLHHILAGDATRIYGDNTYDDFLEDNMPMLMRNNVVPLVIGSSIATCASCCVPIHWVKEKMGIDGDLNRRDLCTGLCCHAIPAWRMRQVPFQAVGLAMPRGISKLKVLRSLSCVDISRHKGAVQEIKRLTWLRKLGVTGVNKRNNEELCSAIAGHSRLESLLVNYNGEPGLSGCLDGLSPPPPNLQSLKLYGYLVTLPKWIQQLGNLVKLKLENSKILEAQATIQVLGKIPNMSVLRLCWRTFDGEEVCLSFRKETFANLVVLEMEYLYNVKSVEFEEGATPKLQQLQFSSYPHETKSGLFSGLPHLSSLKEITLNNNDYTEDFVKELQCQLAKNKNEPVLRRY